VVTPLNHDYFPQHLPRPERRVGIVKKVALSSQDAAVSLILYPDETVSSETPVRPTVENHIPDVCLVAVCRLNNENISVLNKGMHTIARGSETK
jgi:hypothetical protein